MTSIRFPDPEYEAAFCAYVNYFEDLAGAIGGLYGWADSLVAGVHDGVLAHPPLRRIQRRRLGAAQTAALDTALRKAWGTLRRACGEVEDPDVFDEEANAWLPMLAYYSVYHAVSAFAVASGQQQPRDHASALKLAGKEVLRGVLPYPWGAWCNGCPQTGSANFGGLIHTSSVHVLSRPDPGSTDDRIAMLLRTTRYKELERRLAGERAKALAPGTTRRNIKRAEKEQMAAAMPATTLFDVFWRLRKKANYEDADVFVLGAAGETDARRLGESLVIVTEATVAALEALMSAYVGPAILQASAAAYLRRTHAAPQSAIGRRASSWAARLPGASR
jgi:hypothetical protein